MFDSTLDLDTRSTSPYQIPSTDSDDILDVNDIIDADIEEEFEERDNSRILAMNEIKTDGLDHQFNDWVSMTHEATELPEGCDEIHHF